MYGSDGEGGSFGQSSNHRKSKRSNTQLEPDRWYHLAFVMYTNDHDNWKVYINGEDETGGSSGNDDCYLVYDNNAQLGKLGKINQSAEAWFGGIMNNVAMYNKKLEPEQIATLYNDGLPMNALSSSLSYTDADVNALIGYWQMNEGTGTTARDASSNSNNGTLTNGPTWSSKTPWS